MGAAAEQGKTLAVGTSDQTNALQRAHEPNWYTLIDLFGGCALQINGRVT